jgi:hypothetical protein
MVDQWNDLPAALLQTPGPPNKRMQLTKLRAAPVRQAEVPPCAPASRMDGGTASQLIRGVGRTVAERRSDLGSGGEDGEAYCRRT